MNPTLLLKIFSVLLMSFMQVVGKGAVARSQSVPSTLPPTQQVVEAKDSIPASLIELLEPPDSQVRSSAAEALGRIGESAKVAILSLIPLLKDENWQVRSSAAAALGEMGESAKVAIPSLIPLLKDENLDVNSLTGEALKKLGYKPQRKR